MSSQFQPITRVTSDGFDQSTQRHLTKPTTCWQLYNMRAEIGRLEQTPWLELYQALSTLAGEASGYVNLIRQFYYRASTASYLALTSNTARAINQATPATQTLIPAVLQVQKPSNATVTGECLLYGHNTTDFSADGDYIVVAIHTDGSHFRWNRNGGAWSGDLVISAAVAIGANGLYVSFQGAGATTDFTNFNVGDTWKWQRYDKYTSTTCGGSGGPLNTDAYNNDIYTGGTGLNRNILRVRDAFATSVGYSRVFGYHVAVFQNHLFVSRYQYGTYTGSDVADHDTASVTNQLAWSHLNNPDQFFSTNINEADSYTFPQQRYFENANLGIMGLAVWRSLLYVFLADSISTIQYVGLPNVMQIQPLNSSVGSIFQNGVIRTPNGVYFIGRGDVYVIKAFEPESIGQKIRNQLFTDINPYLLANPNSAQNLYGHYHPYAKEVIWTYYYYDANNYVLQRQVVFDEVTGDWHFRNIPNSTTTNGQSYSSDNYCACPKAGSLTQSLWGYKQQLMQDQAAGANSGAIPDTVNNAGAATYVQPFFETPFLPYNDDPFHVKQSSGLFIDAGWTSGTNITVSSAASDMIGTAAATMTQLAQVWTPMISPEVRLSLPRAAFRTQALRFQFTNGNNPVYGAVFNQYQEFIYGLNQGIEK
jgi:hypothetical protein